MSKSAIAAASSTPTVTRETLDETPARALKLLRAIGTSLPVRAALAHRGFTDDDRKEGWSLLHAASGYAPSGAHEPTTDPAVRAAIAALDAWDEDGFRVVRATLERRFPELAAEVLDGIGPSTGPSAVLGVKTLLDRLDALGKSGKGKDKHAHAALELLGARGIDAAERKRLRALVATAESAPALDDHDPAPAVATSAAEAAHVAALIGLRAWYEEWSQIARASVKRRDQLILMGLAKKRKSARAAAGAATAAGAGASAGGGGNGAHAVGASGSATGGGATATGG